MKRCVPLEPAAQAVSDQSAVPPLIFQLPPEQGRRILEEAQDTPVYKYPADISSDYVDTGKWGSIPVYFVMPQNGEARHVIVYIHGAGWVFGSFHTHEKLVRELAARTHSLVVFRSTPARRRQNIQQPLSNVILCFPIFGRSSEINAPKFAGIH